MISGAVGPGDHDENASSIWLVSILGGEPRRLRGDASRAELSPDDSLVAYMSQFGIWLADAGGGNPREFIEAREREIVGSPCWSSDGRRVVYKRLAVSEGRVVATIESRGLDETTSTVLVGDETVGIGSVPGAVWIKDFVILGDRLVYARPEPAPRKRDTNLWELAIDPRSGKPRGAPRRLTDWVGFNAVGLTVRADGKQLVFGNNHNQADVYVGELANAGRKLESPRRLTLDDRDDIPSGWLPDSSAVVFATDRTGTADLLVQGLDRRDAQDLVAGPRYQYGSRLTPDGTAFLYWESEDDAAVFDRPHRLLRIPVGGGPTEVVLEAAGLPEVDCATKPGGECRLITVTPDGTATVSRLDPLQGKGEELFDLRFATQIRPDCALSPDGSQFALVGSPENSGEIRLLDAVTGEPIRNIEVQGSSPALLANVEWSPEGDGFFVTGESPRGVAVLHVDLQGRADVLFEDRFGFFADLKPSPDGRHLAFGMEIWDVNVWMVEM